MSLLKKQKKRYSLWTFDELYAGTVSLLTDDKFQYIQELRGTLVCSGFFCNQYNPTNGFSPEQVVGTFVLHHDRRETEKMHLNGLIQRDECVYRGLVEFKKKDQS